MYSLNTGARIFSIHFSPTRLWHLHTSWRATFMTSSTWFSTRLNTILFRERTYIHFTPFNTYSPLLYDFPAQTLWNYAACKRIISRVTIDSFRISYSKYEAPNPKTFPEKQPKAVQIENILYKSGRKKSFEPKTQNTKDMFRA